MDQAVNCKITRKLSDMLSVYYFFTGDFYKGASEVNEINNNFMVVNKIALTF